VRQHDRFTLNVSLPKEALERRHGGVQVAIRWAGRPNDNLLLRVYRKGRLVASSTGIVSTAQSVLIPGARNGRYLVDVEFDGSLSPSDSVRYEALAEAEFAPPPGPPRLLLPDLVSRPQRHVTFATPPQIFYEPPPDAGQSCFPTEIEEEGAQTCLRFDQTVANRGEGPLEVRLTLPNDPASHERDIVQRIYRSRGPRGFRDRSAGRWEFHRAHNHYHYEAFAISRLWRASRTGAPIGGQPVRVGRKVSFCVIDTEIDAWARKGDGPRTYQFPNCLAPTEQDAHNRYLVGGITPGWADVYDWFLPDQYIDVTGVRSGLYVLQSIVDPDDTVREANERNNCGSVLVRLSGMNAGSPRAKIVREEPGC
jgi:hypothetical protein